jgi:hypothetical protein
MARRSYTPRRTTFTPIVPPVLLIIIVGICLCGCSPGMPRQRLPEPIIEAHPELVEMYWKAWQLLNLTQRSGKQVNGFPKKYLNVTGENVIDQWSTLSMALFGVYGYNVFPVMQTLDLFYQKQRADGFISRVYIENSGEPLHLPTQRDPMVNPPLFTWVELKYFRFSADTSRLKAVFPKLEQYFSWLDSYCRGKNEADDLYYTTPIGSGMMNLPRGDIELGAWCDMSSQMALFARDLSVIADILGNGYKQEYYRRRFAEIARSVQEKLWHPNTAFYYDMSREGKQVRLKTISGYWPLLAGIPDPKTAQQLISHLKDSSEFKSVHLFTSVAQNETDFDPRGFYWRGGVWGIIDYMIVEALKLYGEQSLADSATWNHVDNMSRVYSGSQLNLANVDSKAANFKAGTIWELYAPAELEPGTRWDAAAYGEPDYIAYSGHGPIAMLIENILGFRVDAPDDQLTWNVRRTDRHGIRRLRFGDNLISIWSDPRTGKQPLFTVHGESSSSIKINFVMSGDTLSVPFNTGPVEVTFIPENYFIKDRFKS